MRLFWYIAVVFCVACASAGRLNKLSLGMTKPEILSAIGPPNETRASDGKEFLIYYLYANSDSMVKSPYCLMVESGKLTRYGGMGDCGYQLPNNAVLNINH